MNKIISILGLAILALTTIVSAESFVLWNTEPAGGIPDSLGIRDEASFGTWVVLHSYQFPKYETGWKALYHKYQLSLFDCDWVQPATEYRSERVFKNAGYLKGNQCFLKTTKRVVKPVVEETIVPVEPVCTNLSATKCVSQDLVEATWTCTSRPRFSQEQCGTESFTLTCTAWTRVDDTRTRTCAYTE